MQPEKVTKRVRPDCESEKKRDEGDNRWPACERLQKRNSAFVRNLYANRVKRKISSSYLQAIIGRDWFRDRTGGTYMPVRGRGRKEQKKEGSEKKGWVFGEEEGGV